MAMWAKLTCGIVLASAASAAALPLVFEPAPSGDGFIARTGMGAVHVASTGVRFDNRTALHFDGAKARLAQPLAPLASTSNYFIGRDPAQWRSAVPHYSKVRFRDVYPGVSVLFYGTARGQLEYDFEIQPGADPRLIQMSFTGVRSIRRSAAGDLRIATARGEILERRPRVYQNSQELPARYELLANNRVQFVVSGYHSGSALLIDPVIESATYFGGGSFEAARALKLDAQGNCYLAGQAPSPTLFTGPFPASSNPAVDAVLIKFLAQSNTLAFYTFFGGDQDDIANALAVDGNGAAYVAGSTRSANFPVRNGYQMTPGGGPYPDVFVVKVSADGHSLDFATYLGGGGNDEAFAIAVDATGSAYVGGATGSRNFPVTSGAYQESMRGSALTEVAIGFITRLSPSGNALVSSTLLGGTRQEQVRALALDATGNVFAAGSTSSPDFPASPGAAQTVLPGLVAGFAAALSPDLKQLQFATFIGGRSTTVVNALALTPQGAMITAGYTSGTDFPVRNAVQPAYGGGDRDGFVAVLAPLAGAYQFATFLGGSDTDTINDLTLESNGILTVAGSTASADFPRKAALQSFQGRSPNQDAFVAKFQTLTNSLLFATTIGGAADDQAFGVVVDSSGATWIAGVTASSDFPVVKQTAYQSQFGGGAGDMFLLKLSADPTLIGAIPTLNLSASIVSFTATQGSIVAPAPVPISVSAAQPGPLSFTVDWTTQSGGNWLSASPARADAPAMFSVFASPSGLPLGVYTGSVRLVPSGGGSPVAVGVTLTVAPPAPSIQSMAPSIVATGSPDTVFTITGANFQTGATVRLLSTDGGTLLQTITPFAMTDTQMQFTATANYLFRDASFLVRVANPDQSVSNTAGLQVGSRFPAIASGGVSNTASGASDAIAPGEYVTITGSNLGPATPQRVTIFGDGAGVSLAGVSVYFNGVAAPLMIVSDSKIVTAVPFALAGQQAAQIAVQYQGLRSNPVSIAVAAVAPGMFTLDGSGIGEGLIFNENSASNTVASPAAKGSVISIYFTGAGQQLPAGVDGKIAVAEGTGPVAPLSVAIDGQLTELVSIGNAIGQVTGMLKARVRVPANAHSGSNVPILVTVGGIPSQPNVTLAIQ